MAHKSSIDGIRDPRFRQKARESWLRDWETLIVRELPHMSGRLDWNTGIHQFNVGLRVDYAARRYIDVLKIEGNKS